MAIYYNDIGGGYKKVGLVRNQPCCRVVFVVMKGRIVLDILEG